MATVINPRALPVVVPQTLADELAGSVSALGLGKKEVMYPPLISSGALILETGPGQYLKHPPAEGGGETMAGLLGVEPVLLDTLLSLALRVEEYHKRQLNYMMLRQAGIDICLLEEGEYHIKI